VFITPAIKGVINLKERTCEHASSILTSAGNTSCTFGPGWGDLPEGVAKNSSGRIIKSGMTHDLPDCGVNAMPIKCRLPDGKQPGTRIVK
jgi:hypothetical protein